MISCTFLGQLAGLNDMTNNASRGHWSSAAKLKKEQVEFFQWSVKRNLVVTPTDWPAEAVIVYYEPDMRRDVDNVTGAGAKIILDALVELKVLPNDSRKYIRKLTQDVLVDKVNPRIEVTIKEIEL